MSPEERRVPEAGDSAKNENGVQNRQRFYISIPYDVKENGTSITSFFEVLKEYKNFALLSLRYDVEIVKVSVNPGRWVNSQTSFRPTELLCILDANGNIHPYLATSWLGKNRITRHERKERVVIDAGLLKQYLRQDFYQLKEFANKNKLSFERREDLFTIFNYYDEIATE